MALLYEMARQELDGELLIEGMINSLKRHKDDAKEVKEGLGVV